jgi:hypothetical protein
MTGQKGEYVSQKLKRAKRLAARLFLIYCVIFTVISLMFEYRVASFTGLSTTDCTALFIDADSEESLRAGLVDEFIPTFVFSFGEPTNLREEMVVPYQIIPDEDVPGQYVLRGAVAYPTDYGSTSLGIRLNIGTDGFSITLSKTVLRAIGWVFGQAHVDAHNGDAEMFELYLMPAEEAGFWEIDHLNTYPHGIQRTYLANQFTCFRDSPLLYVSRGKHAMYASLRECNHSSVVHRQRIHVTAELCSIGELYYPSTSPEFNVGDSTRPNNIFETSRTIAEREIFVDEDAWESCFYGGHGNGDDDGPCRSRFRWE